MKIIILILFCFPIISTGQISNLVLNSDLEDVNICTEYHSPCSPAAWFAINQNNAQGFIHQHPVPAASGKHYLKILTATLRNDHRQYWQTKLSCPVIDGKKYRVALKVAAEEIGPNLNDVGVWLTSNFIRSSTDTLLQPVNFITFRKAKAKKLKQGWFQIETEFTASSNCQVIVIGNFSNRTNSAIIDERKIGPTVSIMIDDIEILPISDNCLPNMNFKDSLYQVKTRHIQDSVIEINEVETTPMEVAKEDTIEISDILFDFNSYKLKDTAVMNLIGDRLRKAKFDQIRIVGFTDTSGSDSYNQALSLRRAQSISDLISAKYFVPSSRIVAVGGGVSRKYNSPIKNRRVEVIFSDKGSR